MQFERIVYERVYAHQYFITSEGVNEASGLKYATPRFTIRQMTPDSTIETIGKLGKYGSFDDAVNAVKTMD